MLWYEIISEEERKTYIKRIEFHLRNWKNYKAAVLNLERRMEKEQKNGLAVKERNAEYQIDVEKRLYQFLLDSMETAVSELDELERKLVECRYIHNWSMGKCAMEIGYSEKTLFLMKKSLLDKLLVSLAAITNI
ncbi:transcriptional regulator [Bacillus haynesii]|uniref:transcriptional regulator n=1 Tax=Bacillus haynesii TaxID=1925021 RepID=UPI002281840B|nr:transcriptional regulator [Bacillus haynesii]MCY7753790.1 transcriptional regulator [Bacillus haynesii]MCY7771131.1 transcriptional regulator [Bacillus haynesii]MCY7861493.1 transcriptional regulator [Bacillus haynesii]MCY7913151.1 transcriptional regulator [Bacillus haynesii]MCY7927723.1 transcriptional regulator [Bacillus haynesii]